MEILVLFLKQFLGDFDPILLSDISFFAIFNNFTIFLKF